MGWLHRDGWGFISLHEKGRLQHHPEPGRKPPASEYNIPLIPGSAIPVNIEQMLERISFAVAYAHSMLLVDVSTIDGDANSVRIDKKRCSAAQEQLSLAKGHLKHLKVAIASQAPGDLPEGCSRLQVITRRPENFILTNIESGAHWRGSSHGVWRRKPE